MDDPVGRVRVQPVEAGARVDERAGVGLLGDRAGDADRCRDLALLPVRERVRFYKTLSLLASGGAPRITNGPEELTERMELVSLLEEKGFLFARYARSVNPAD